MTASNSMLGPLMSGAVSADEESSRSDAAPGSNGDCIAF